jgi:hypothetical protein
VAQAVLERLYTCPKVTINGILASSTGLVTARMAADAFVQLGYQMLSPVNYSRGSRVTVYGQGAGLPSRVVFTLLPLVFNAMPRRHRIAAAGIPLRTTTRFGFSLRQTQDELVISTCASLDSQLTPPRPA